MNAVMIRSVRNFQSGTGVRLRGLRLMAGSHGVVSASTKEFPPFRLRIAELQRLLTLEAAVQDFEFDLQDVTQLRWNRQGTFDRLLELSIADSTEAA
ncbi:MAG: hypothetical protein JWO19_2047 [Bryobacterales bacterium]|nr:hypothetical protein [Bryobacterales bacterium]